jgi:hypothetical protein
MRDFVLFLYSQERFYFLKEARIRGFVFQDQMVAAAPE